MPKKLIVVAIAAALAASVAPTAAGAPTEREASKAGNTNVTVFWGGSNWYGQVKSSRNSCENGRKVTLYRKTAGSDSKVGSDRSEPGKGDTEGVWRLPPKGKPVFGKYYAKVGDKGNCDGAKSKVYDYPDDNPAR